MMSGCSEAKKKTTTDKPQIKMVVADNGGQELGTMIIELWPDIAPKHVERIQKLVKEGFYNGLTFHRVIEGFMVQGGCPLGTGTGGSKYPDLHAEFNDTKHVRGVLSMARAMDPNSANSQFFIMLDDAPHLDGQYTAFGKVVEGIDTLDLIKRGSPFDNGSVTNPSIMKSVSIVE